MSLEISEQITSATSVIRNHIIKHNRKNRDDKIDYITIEPERVSVFYVKSEYQAQHTDAPNNNEALLKLHRMYNDMNSKVEQIHSRMCGEEEEEQEEEEQEEEEQEAIDHYENIELNSFWLPAQNRTQVDAVNHIIQYTKEMVKVMKEPSHNKLIRHPNFAEDGWRNRVYDLFKRCKQQNSEDYFYINIYRFQAGYCVKRDEGNNEQWAKHLLHFQKACRIYYELVRHVVAIMSKNHEGGRIDTEWQQKIKRAIFDIEIDYVYFRNLNSRNWLVLKHRVKNYCDRIRLSRREESDDGDDDEEK